VTQDDYAQWCSFVLNALAGKHADVQFRNFYPSIIKAARYIHERLQKPRNGNVIWRGLYVSVWDASGSQLAALDHTTYLSFSRDETMARVFADKDHPLSRQFSHSQWHQNMVGVLCRDVVREDEVLFDYRWYESTALMKLRPEWADIVAEQQEIMLENRKHPLQIVSKVAPSSTKFYWDEYPETLSHAKGIWK